jgi:hypothetical protein
VGSFSILVFMGKSNGDNAKEEPLDEEEDAAGGSIEEFDRLDMSGGIDGIAKGDLFEEEVWTRVASSIEVGLTFYDTI